MGLHNDKTRCLYWLLLGRCFNSPLVPQPFLLCWVWLGVSLSLSRSLCLSLALSLSLTEGLRKQHSYSKSHWLDVHMIKASAVVLAVGEISPEGSRLYIMGIHTFIFFFLFQTILDVLQVIHLHISVNIIRSPYVCMDIFKGCFCGCWCICASFQGALAEECRRNFPRMGAGSVVSAT